MRIWPLLAVAAIACTHPRPAPRAERGMLTGMVRDGISGAGIDGATLVLRRSGDLEPVTDHTTGDGIYMIPDLALGTYVVRVYVAKQLVGERTAEIGADGAVGLDFTIAGAGVAVPDPNAPGAPELWRFHAPDADPTRATIEGTVADAATHRRVADAVVSITRSGTIETVQTITDEAGRYRVDTLAPGTYDVSAYYTVLQRGQLEVKRTLVEVAGGETVAVPLWIETDRL